MFAALIQRIMLDCKGNVKFVDTTDPPLIPAVATLRTAPKPDSAAAADADDDTVTSSDSPLSLVLPAAGIAGVVLLAGAVGCYVKRSRVRAAAAAAAAVASAEGEARTADGGSMASGAQSEESVQSVGSSTDGGGSQQSVEPM